MTTTAQLAGALTILVRDLPGVEFLYPAVPLLGALPVGRPRDAVAVSERDGSVSVTAVIGVDDEDPAIEVCRLVFDAVDAFLAASGHAVGTIEVKVGSIG